MIKRLAACVRQYKKDSILTPLYVTMEVVLEVIIPLLMARLIDFGIDGGSMSYIVKWALRLSSQQSSRLSLVRCQAEAQQSRRQASQKICATTCFITYRAFRFPISTSFDSKYRDAPNDRYHEHTKRLSDDYPHRGALSRYAYFFIDYGV